MMTSDLHNGRDPDLYSAVAKQLQEKGVSLSRAAKALFGYEPQGDNLFLHAPSHSFMAISMGSDGIERATFQQAIAGSSNNMTLIGFAMRHDPKEYASVFDVMNKLPEQLKKATLIPAHLA